MLHPATRLRSLLAEPEVLLAPGTFNAMAAKLAQAAGFKAVYVPGGGTALAQYGMADLGLVTMSEMVANAAAIAAAVDIPVIADADTGFGNALNVQRCVREYERAGVAAIHLEDQQFPKKCGFFEGKTLVSVQEAAAKIRAAVEARQHPDFLVIARCDALSVGGVEEVKARAQAYLQAGADMLFVEGSGSATKDLPRQIGGMHVFNMSASGKVAPLTAREVGELGYKLMLFPNFATLAAIKAMKDVYQMINTDHSIENTAELCASFAEFTELGGIDAFNTLQKRFAI